MSTDDNGSESADTEEDAESTLDRLAEVTHKLFQVNKVEVQSRRPRDKDSKKGDSA